MAYQPNELSDHSQLQGGPDDSLQTRTHLSAFAWDELRNQHAGVNPDSRKELMRADSERSGVDKDGLGRITRWEDPNGRVYQYGRFDVNGQPTQLSITDSRTGDWWQWKQEENGVWRAYHRNEPTRQILRGSMHVDVHGVLHEIGVRGRLDYAAQISRDSAGRVTRVDRGNGMVLEYGKFGSDGQPAVIKISDTNRGEWGYWVKERPGLWRAYHKDRPNNQVLKGEWSIDGQGNMHREGQIEQPRDNSAQPRTAHDRTIGPGPRGVPGKAPEGYQTVRSKLSPQAVATARSLLGGEYGTMTPFEVDGKRYMARVEPHYGPPGRKNGPVGWHKGVTLYEAVT